MSESAPSVPPLNGEFIVLILELILSEQLSPHLISVPLLQRHNFLHVSSSDPIAYLTWPSNDGDGQETINEFNRIELQNLGASFPVRYSGDPENLFAHVNVAARLGLIFLWDPTDETWKYHNASSTMSFPKSFQTIDEALAAIHPLEDSDIGDSYWDGYDSPLENKSNSSSTPLPLEQSDEAAYWAQYSHTEGSGDSAQPSPPLKRPSHDGPITIQVPYSTLHPTSTTPYDPLSAYELSNRLDSIDLNRDADVSEEKARTNGPVYWNGFGALGERERKTEQLPLLEPVEDAVRGAYNSWLAARAQAGMNGTAKDFLEVVRRVINDVDINP
ncbi:hypothetical protein C8J56DRAFT_850985 [Mycena floridula]|nr:hypothetical protein C8J56DRAFT_850985 [Mycena floridula]